MGAQAPTFDYKRLGRLLSAFLGPQPSQEDLRHFFFSYTNIVAQLYGRGPPYSGSFLGSASTAYPFGLYNSVGVVSDHIAQWMRPPLTNNELVGVVGYVSESADDLLEVDSETLSDSHSIKGSHHPSCECFMAEVPDGHVSSNASDSDEKPREVPVRIVVGGARVLPPPAPVASAPPQQGRMLLEQLQAQQQEPDEA